MKKVLKLLLARSAKKIIAVYQPEIISITGSVGKTTTKEAIRTVLENCFYVRASYKNYNNEIGVPLTIIGIESPGRSLNGWRTVLKTAKQITINRVLDYPKMLILEMGVDRPGDMDYLMKIVKPTRAVITRLGSAHAEFFTSVDHLHQEKLRLASALPSDGILIYNFEDEKLRGAVDRYPVKTISYGFAPEADVRAEHIQIVFGNDHETAGVTFKLVYNGSAVPVHIPGVIGKPTILAALAGAAVGFTYDMNALEIAHALKGFHIPAGRLRVLNGLYSSIIIDDTYNSSPEAVIESLRVINDIGEQGNKRWAVLGDMRELGTESRLAHEAIGKLCAEQSLDTLITVGQEAEYISRSAIIHGMAETAVHHFSNALTAADYIKKNLSENDVILIKGSQAVRLEKIVKQLLQDQSKAGELLVRQGKEWENTN